MFVLGIKCCCFDTAKHVREDTLHIHKYLGETYSISSISAPDAIGICFYITAVASMVTGIQERQSLNDIINGDSPTIHFERFIVCETISPALTLGVFTDSVHPQRVLANYVYIAVFQSRTKKEN